MKKHVSLFLPALFAASVWLAYADEGHDHANSTHSQVNTSNGTHGKFGHGGNDAHHQHQTWVDPPKTCVDKVSDVWTRADTISRGEDIYTQYCIACHGADGRGTGTMAKILPHPPADLTNNFHASPGNSGDAYLFWRVSEGGTVQPFKSQQSQMPAFKDILTESERWAVLAYVHSRFH